MIKDDEIEAEFIKHKKRVKLAMFLGTLLFVLFCAAIWLTLSNFKDAPPKVKEICFNGQLFYEIKGTVLEARQSSEEFIRCTPSCDGNCGDEK